MSDRFGLVLLKSSVAVSDVTIAGVGVAWGGLSGLLRRILLVLAGFILGLLTLLIAVGRRLALLLIAILRTTARVAFTAGKVTARTTARASRQVTTSASVAATGAMARRSARHTARAEIRATIAEDPLRTQNRVLSALVVILGVIVLGVVLWATDPARSQGAPLSAQAAQAPVVPLAVAQAAGGDVPGPADPTSVNPQQEVAAAPTMPALPSPVPTATSLPVLLEVRGTLAYVVREKGQTDIWAIPVGSRTPLRLTNSPEDERDPAWSPDGRKLAYASRQDGNWEIYVHDLQAGETTRMTYDLSFQAAPTWSPDGEWLVYESYQGNNLDLYVMRVDGTQPPQRLTDHPQPDFSPAWSPDGRTIAFVSWRDGNEDVYLFSLDDPRDDAVVNVTNTPTRHEDFPSWSPAGDMLAFSAVDEGIEKVFVRRVDDLSAPSQVLERGRTPTWSPDAGSIVFAVDSLDSTHLVAAPFAGSGVTTEIIPVAPGSQDPQWTASPLPPALVNSGGVAPAVTDPLFVEQESQPQSDPPYRLRTLNNVQAPSALLSERVDDSFMALREAASGEIGWDFLGQLEDAFWSLSRPPQPGEERRNWLMTGRSFAINRNAIVGYPAPIEVVREDLGVDTYWRLYVRVSDEAQAGQLGEPLRHMPWDFASRNQGDLEAYNNGGRPRLEMPRGYYVDLTQIALDYGWLRVAAGSDWRRNFNSTNYWLFQKRDGLDWYAAMREQYTEAQLGGFAPRPTPPPAPPAGVDGTAGDGDTGTDGVS